MAESNIRTIETNVATIKFTGSVGTDSSNSESESENEPLDLVSVTVKKNNNKTENLLNDNTNSSRDCDRISDAQTPRIINHSTHTKSNFSIENIDKTKPLPYSKDFSHDKSASDDTIEHSTIGNVPPRFNPFDKEEYDPNENIFPQLDEKEAGKYTTIFYTTFHPSLSITF